MKSDLDRLMKAQNLDALLITGPTLHNPFMVYFTGTAHITSADLVKRAGEEPVLFFPSMEREEAARTGLKTIGYSKYPMADFLKLTQNDIYQAMVLRYERMLADAGVTEGRVAVYGVKEIGEMFSLLNSLQELNPALQFIGYQTQDVLLQAMATKSEAELAHIHAMGEITVGVVDRVKHYLADHRVVDEVLFKDDGTPLTIGEVKAKINLWLAEAGAENPEATIFAIGRDGGVPHSTGTATDVLRLGSPIVFDIFPCEAGGGYFYDFTRTWCLGYAPDDVKALYQNVREVYETVVSELRQNCLFKTYQARTCELFQAQGHPTIQEKPGTEEGYVHSLGHGVGLHIHEQPFSGMLAGETEILAPGSVFTIEPGLYYPERGMGIRLEDTYYVDQNGNMQCFVPYSLDLVVEMKHMA